VAARHPSGETLGERIAGSLLQGAIGGAGARDVGPERL
jgi:hypothetical protein